MGLLSGVRTDTLASLCHCCLYVERALDAPVGTTQTLEGSEEQADLMYL